MNPIGEPDAGNQHVRFDERGWETGDWQSLKHRAYPRLYPLRADGCDGRGRDGDCSPPPAQIRTCSFPAYGSHLGFGRSIAEAMVRMRPSAGDTRFLALGPERALLAAIPLGLGPSLHQLRSGSLRLVRRLPSYYGLVRLPAPVHHRLQLFTFPMRTLGHLAIGQTRDLPVSDAILPRVMCSSTPAGWTAPRMA